MAGTGTRPVRLPGCKSTSARALVLATLARGRSVLSGLSDSEDTVALRRALAALGASFRDLPDGSVAVEGLGGPPRLSGQRLDAGEAATNLRFLACLAAAGRGEALLTGSPGLRARPHGPLFAFLASLGVETTETADGWRIRGRGLPGGVWRPPVELSSQFLSALALAALADAEVRLVLPARIPSAGYFRLTLAAVRAFRGCEAAAATADGLLLRPAAAVGRRFAVPADASGATFFLAAAAAAGRPVAFARPWASEHPEAELNAAWIAASRLLAPTAEAAFAPGGPPPEQPLELDLDSAPDAGPALTGLAVRLPAGIRFRGLARLRHKESDRVAGMAALAAAAGGEVVEEQDGALFVRAGRGRPAAAPFDPRHDHRLAMAAAVAGLEVADPACVGKSFPEFWKEWNAWSRP
ncbi:MAG: hypothetical protein D6702_10360 [Planctomycetota bacterium]|nr:MAG: hypothetical protein D6702_10360 [Planctomycetota bacterium]